MLAERLLVIGPALAPTEVFGFNFFSFSLLILHLSAGSLEEI